MFEAREDILLAPGTWRMCKAGNPPTIFFSCPYCTIITMIEENVAQDGVVDGIVRCGSLKCCTRGVRLVGWKA